MAKTYKVEEKAGIGTDQNLSDTTGWTVHGSNLSYDQAVTKMKELINAGSNPIDIRSLRDDGGVEIYSYPSEEDKLHLDGS